VTGEVWIGLEENIIGTAVDKSRNHLCACGPDISKNFYCRQLKNEQLNELSAQVTEMLENVFYVLLLLSDNAPFHKNTIFCWLCFCQVLQKQTLGAAGN